MKNTIRITIDKAGRCVIPKNIRQELGLQPGMPLELTTQDGKIELFPVPLSVKLEERNGLCVAVPLQPIPILTVKQSESAKQAIRNRNGGI